MYVLVARDECVRRGSDQLVPPHQYMRTRSFPRESLLPTPVLSNRSRASLYRLPSQPQLARPTQVA